MEFVFRPRQIMSHEEETVLRDFVEALNSACNGLACEDCGFKTWCEKYPENPADTVWSILEQLGLE